MARPRKYIIDTAEVEKLASYGCTTREIADFFGCPESTISKGYSEYVRKGFNETKKRLRMSQLKKAFGGSDTMLIWLGKNYLGQSDKHDAEVSISTAELASRIKAVVSASGTIIAPQNDNQVSAGNEQI